MEKLLIFQHFDEFFKALENQLIEDDKRWGRTYLERNKEEQEERIEIMFKNYFDQSRFANVPIPWLKVAGLAYIAWLRENHPEMSEAWQDN